MRASLVFLTISDFNQTMFASASSHVLIKTQC